MKNYTLTAQHIAALKLLHVFWIEVEGGAPAVLRPEDFASLVTDSDNWAPELTESESAELDTQMQIALKYGELASGRYCVTNKIRPALGSGVFGEPGARWPMLLDKEVCLDFKTEHRLLLAAAQFSSGCIDPKRPYGDMSYWEIDAAEILGMPLPRGNDGDVDFSDDQLALFDQLHRETWPALMLLLEHMTLAPGDYVDATGNGDWGPA